MKTKLILGIIGLGIIAAFSGGLYLGLESSKQVKAVVAKMSELNTIIERANKAVEEVERILQKVQGLQRALDAGYEFRIQERQGSIPYPFRRYFGYA